VTRYAFATTEFWPLTDGGAGRLNADVVDLLVASGHDVHVVLVAGIDVYTDDAKVHVVHATDSAGWDIDFMAASKAAAEGLADLNRKSRSRTSMGFHSGRSPTEEILDWQPWPSRSGSTVRSIFR